MKTTPLANIWFAKNDGVNVQVTNVDFFRPKKTQSDYFVRRVGVENSQTRCSACSEGSTKNNETNERFEKTNSPSGGEFKITNNFFTKKQQQNNRTKNEDFNTNAEQNKKNPTQNW